MTLGIPGYLLFMFHSFALALAASLSVTGLPNPASQREALLVSPAWLAQHLKDPNLVLLHIGDQADYAAGHIEGARHVTLQDISVSDRSGLGNGLNLEMPPPSILRERLAGLGLSDDSRVIVYFGNAPLQSATRVIFTLDHAGLGARTSLLDGGQAAWIREGRALTTVVPVVRPGRLSPLEVRPLVVTREQVKPRSGVAIVDARASPFYDGTRSGGGMLSRHRAGHIPGAISIPFTEVADERLVLRSPEDLAARFAAKGVKPGDTVLAYCHLGQQATAVLFAARTLGHKVLLYDGSFEDWTRFSEYPVVKP
jgi:thiosulfate/3-mercaptopyruvate sulfurtransferase